MPQATAQRAPTEQRPENRERSGRSTKMRIQDQEDAVAPERKRTFACRQQQQQRNNQKVFKTN